MQHLHVYDRLLSSVSVQITAAQTIQCYTCFGFD